MKIKKKKLYYKQQILNSTSRTDIVDYLNCGYLKLQNYNVVHRNDFFENEREFFLSDMLRNPVTTELTLTLENIDKNNSLLDSEEIIKFLFSNTTNLNPNLKLLEDRKRLSFGHEENFYFRVPDCSIGTIQNIDSDVMNQLNGNKKFASKCKGLMNFRESKKIYDLLREDLKYLK